MPPPPEEICKIQKKSFIDISDEEYDRTCNYEELEDKANRNALDVERDLIPCYDPVCTTDGKYARLQCSYNVPEWCWCADKEGRPIEGTLEKGKKAEECGKYNNGITKLNR